MISRMAWGFRSESGVSRSMKSIELYSIPERVPPFFYTRSSWSLLALFSPSATKQSHRHKPKRPVTKSFAFYTNSRPLLLSTLHSRFPNDALANRRLFSGVFFFA